MSDYIEISNDIDLEALTTENLDEYNAESTTQMDVVMIKRILIMTECLII